MSCFQENTRLYHGIGLHDLQRGPQQGNFLLQLLELLCTLRCEVLSEGGLVGQLFLQGGLTATAL